MADSGLRRFNEVILLIARKNGKTTFVAGIDLAEFFLSRGEVDIVCASNTTEQANILFEEINNMREQSPALSKETRSKKNIYHIYSPKTKNKIKKLSAQSRNKDGYNIEVGCIDEVHEMTDSKVYDAIKQSQSTKKEPLIFIITTEGTTVGGFLDNKLDYARKMLKGEIILAGDEKKQAVIQRLSEWVSNLTGSTEKAIGFVEDNQSKIESIIDDYISFSNKMHGKSTLSEAEKIIADKLNK